MSVYIETSAGDIVVDLLTDECPVACKNFIKLCKMKYYNNCLFYKVAKNFIAQTGDPKNDGSGGSSVYGLLEGPSKRCFQDEIIPELKHLSAGMLGMSSGKKNANGSQFYITLAANLDSLDGKHTLFAEIAEDEEQVVAALNSAVVDDDERPLQNIRIRRTVVLDDPFPDPDGLEALIPEQSPEPVYEFGDRLEEDWKPEEDTRNEEEIEQEVEEQKAKNRRILLEMIGDRPDADAKAPDEFLFVCKLNPITNEEDLETIFSRFGEVIACDIIRDKKTGDSLNYAFIGFAEKKSAEEAYLKMNNALIDDRRIKVDFSQSMYHQWKMYRRFNMDQGNKTVGNPRKSGDGILLSGGRLKLKSDAHGQGVGALGLTGHGHGHGLARRDKGRDHPSADMENRDQRRDNDHRGRERDHRSPGKYREDRDRDQGRYQSNRERDYRRDGDRAWREREYRGRDQYQNDRDWQNRDRERNYRDRDGGPSSRRR